MALLFNRTEVPRNFQKVTKEIKDVDVECKHQNAIIFYRYQSCIRKQPGSVCNLLK